MMPSLRLHVFCAVLDFSSFVQEQGNWDEQAEAEVVHLQSTQLGHLLHLVHSRPAFPLSQTADSFWHKLAMALQNSQLTTPAELQLLTHLAGMSKHAGRVYQTPNCFNSHGKHPQTRSHVLLNFID